MKGTPKQTIFLGLSKQVSSVNGRSRAAVWLILLSYLMLAGCSNRVGLTLEPVGSASQIEVEATTLPTTTAAIPSASPTASLTPVDTSTQTISPGTATPTITLTPSITPSPTSEFPVARILMQAFCRYGPAKAYLYSHGLYEGDLAEIHGRNFSSGWLWIKPANLERHCWAAASVMEVSGDVSDLPVVQTRLPYSTLYGPPEDVQAVREGDRVMVTWNRVDMTLDDDRGYLIEATVCQNGSSVWVAIQTNENYYEFTDEQNCSGTSNGKLYTVEKHGYTDPVEIPWP